jgi:hypothetical protein
MTWAPTWEFAERLTDVTTPPRSIVGGCAFERPATPNAQAIPPGRVGSGTHGIDLADVRRIGGNLRKAAPDEFAVDEQSAGIHVRQQTAVTVITIDIELEADARAHRYEPREQHYSGICVDALADLVRVSDEQPDMVAASARERIAIDDPCYDALCGPVVSRPDQRRIELRCAAARLRRAKTSPFRISGRPEEAQVARAQSLPIVAADPVVDLAARGSDKLRVIAANGLLSLRRACEPPERNQPNRQAHQHHLSISVPRRDVTLHMSVLNPY